jgi:hypothetical protein
MGNLEYERTCYFLTFVVKRFSEVLKGRLERRPYFFCFVFAYFVAAITPKYPSLSPGPAV